MEEQEKVQVKVVADDSPAPTKQEQEAAVLDQAVETGEVASEYGLQDDGVYKINLDKPPVQKEENNAVQERKTEEVSVDESSGDSKEVDKEVREQSSEQKRNRSKLKKKY
jgi:predicted Zn-dependent protease